MATNTMTTQSEREHTLQISEPSVQQIIAKARSKPVRAGSKGAWLLSGISALLLWASFAPLDWGPLAWIALVPLIQLVRIQERTAWMYFAVYSTSLISVLAMLQWMRLGHQTMYVAWFALSIYMAMYIPAFVLLARTAVHRFHVPLTLAVPVIWVGLEFARAHFLTGFSWYYLAHSQYRWIELIQISDLTGAYGVSFVIATASAAVAGLLPTSIFCRLKLLPPGAVPESPAPNATKRRAIAVAVSLCLVVAATTYGYVRRAQADFREGPRVGLVQGNFTSEVKHDSNNSQRIYYVHRELTGITVSRQPDVIVWPESMYPSPLFESSPDITVENLKAIAPPIPNINLDDWVQAWRDPTTPRAISDLSREAGTPMIIGAQVCEAQPDRYQTFNSALFVEPQTGIQKRYDKLHRVPFGEFIPFRDELPFLRRFTPFSDQFGIAAGAKPVRFDDAKRGFSYAPLICFEDTVPHVTREIVRATSRVDGQEKPVDCLVNLTNDGWFHGSSELDEHLIIAAFRAVECRTPIVRAVNTGISAYVDGDGVILEPEFLLDAKEKDHNSMRDPKTGKWYKQRTAAMVHPVPLDNRRSLYVQFGDWFASLCSLGVAIALIGTLLPRRKHRAVQDASE